VNDANVREFWEQMSLGRKSLDR